MWVFWMFVLLVYYSVVFVWKYFDPVIYCKFSLSPPPSPATVMVLLHITFYWWCCSFTLHYLLLTVLFCLLCCRAGHTWSGSEVLYSTEPPPISRALIENYLTRFALQFSQFEKKGLFEISATLWCFVTCWSFKCSGFVLFFLEREKAWIME